MTRVARTLEAEGTQTGMTQFAIGPSHGGLPNFRIGVLNFRPAATDGSRNAKEDWEEVNFPDRVIGEAEHAPFGAYGGTGENGGFEGLEEGLFAEASYFAMDENCPLSSRSMASEERTNCP